VDGMLWLHGRRAKLLIAAISMAAIAVGLVLAWAFGPAQAGARDAREFTVEAGWGTARIANELNAVGLVRSSLAFAACAVLDDAEGRLQAGRYLLSPGMTPCVMVRMMANGEALSNDNVVTIPEGMNVWEIDATLAKAGVITAGELRAQFSYKEGHLFPETYRFAKDATVQDIVNKMEATYFERGGTRGDIDLIVASILEKEAKTPEDMAMVAGIIQKRLEINMALQIDATVGYGWCVRTKGFGRDCDVTQAPIATEIKIDGPYNTYARRGLPQAAISNPGIDALKAAANPKKSDYLYYLSTRDGSQLIYSKTLDEHLENRAKYLGF
jgi:UPF0755 protein